MINHRERNEIDVHARGPNARGIDDSTASRSYGNTNLGASNDARELEGWLKAGTGDDKTDILVIADFYDRAAMFSSDRQLDSNAFSIPWGGFDFRSATFRA